MRAYLLIGILVIYTACSSASGPAGHDPTVLITNQTNWPVYFEWRDGQGVAGADTVAGHVERCVRFFARPDSAYWYVQITNPNLGGQPNTATMTAPWFDPEARPTWHLTITAGVGSPDILAEDQVAAC